MNKLINDHGIIRQNWIFILGLCLCFYFGYHTLQGERSIVRLISLKQSVATLSLENDTLVAQRDALEQKVTMMRPGNIDSDLLEERVRLVLGYKHEDEIVLVMN